MSAFAGLDGFAGGWIAAMDHDGRLAIELLPSFEVARNRSYDSLVIDIPIGLPESGARACDSEARALIGPRRSSVFPAPIRPMLAAQSYEEACRIRTNVEQKSCSKQLFAILPKIKEVDDVMTPELQRQIREGHPEVTFCVMNGGVPLDSYKGTPEGRDLRLSLLRRELGEIDAVLAPYLRTALITDAIDAFAMLWSARRVAQQEARVLPKIPQLDARGLRLEMVA